MSEEKKEQSTTPESGLDQISLDDENKEELIASDSLDKMMEELKADADGKPQQATQEIEKPVSAAPAEDVKKYKLFFVSDMDEEAEYLHSMSEKGLHFVRKNGIQYIFKKDTPKNYYYHLGYYEKDIRDPDQYVENYKEAGWDNIYHEKGEFNGVWNYFRTEMETGTKPEIFSDRTSRIAFHAGHLFGFYHRASRLFMAGCKCILHYYIRNSGFRCDSAFDTCGFYFIFAAVSQNRQKA